ncbi:MAG: hypothetical protein KJZ92_15760 [Rhodocyclaceae bacterium]|nr:hypothetical protein [Rhodocyclaceae bacterium]
MKQKIAILSLVSVIAAGCATPTVVETRKLSDGSLDCAAINNELAEADRFEKEARKERTVTGTNVAAALFFWPALIGTYANTEEAINAAKERKQHLMDLAKKKGC